MNKKGFTLVELLMVITILIIMTVILVGILNPTALVNKATDARKKKDLHRIRVAFEEYFNDKGCYPSGELLEELQKKSNCSSSQIFSPWLNSWPCDPMGNPYLIEVRNTFDCPKWFRLLTKLDNKDDKDISGSWQVPDGNGQLVTVNYEAGDGDYGGAYDAIDPYCLHLGGCAEGTINGACSQLGLGGSCAGSDCFVGDCLPNCRINQCP